MAVDESALEPVIIALGEHGFRPKKLPPAITVGDHKFAQFLYAPPEEFYDVHFDLLLAETALQKSAITRRIRSDVPGLSRPIDVLNCDDLILFKLIAGRFIDRADAAMLLRDNRDAIDFNYLKRWIAELEIQEVYGEVWRDAFPDESEPA